MLTRVGRNNILSRDNIYAIQKKVGFLNLSLDIGK